MLHCILLILLHKYFRFIPNKKVSSFRYRDKAFCGTFSKDGDIFVTAGQGNK